VTHTLSDVSHCHMYGCFNWHHSHTRLPLPQLFVDTTGWAFTFPLARLAGARVAAYVHYPFISSNMIRRVAAGQHGYNNDHRIAGSWIKSIAKLAYYHIFAFIYGIVGSFSQV